MPLPEPAEGTLALAGKAVLSLIPSVGGLAVEFLGHALKTRDDARRYEHDLEIARALDAVIARLDGSLMLDDIVASDEFLSAVNYSRRVASETASNAKRERLARAAASSGPWTDFAASERTGFLRLTAKYDDLHIWLLAYFADPVAWLDAHDLTHVHEGVSVAEMGTQLAWALDMGTPSDRSPVDVPAVVQDALEELAMDSILSPIILDAARDNPFAQQATSRGRRFLAYIRTDATTQPVPLDI